MTHTRKGFTLIELLVVIAIIAILAAILFPVFAKAREKARQAQCQSNVRQIMVAVQIYMQDHNNSFPDRDKVWGDINLPPKTLACPTFNKATQGYGYNYWLSALPLSSRGLGASQTIPVVTDCKVTSHFFKTPSDVDARHSDKAVVGFADGHVEVLPTGRVIITPITQNELLTESYPEWNPYETYMALHDVPFPSRYCTLRPASWQSPLFTDPTNSGGWGTSALTVYGQASVAIFGRSYGSGAPRMYPYTGNPDEVYVRIPIRVANSIPAAGAWLMSIPQWNMPRCGGKVGVTETTTPGGVISGFSELNILDAAYQKIVSFRLSMQGTDATYTCNGTELLKVSNAAVINTASAFPVAPDRNWTYSKGDTISNLLMTGYGNGSVLCSFSSTSDPSLSGYATVTKLSGDIKEPRWIELRVSTYDGATDVGQGSFQIWHPDFGGGIYWDAFSEFTSNN